MVVASALMLLHCLLIFLFHHAEDRPEIGLPRLVLETPARAALALTVAFCLVAAESAALAGLLPGRFVVNLWTLSSATLFFAALLGGAFGHRTLIDLVGAVAVVLLGLSLRLANHEHPQAPFLALLTYPAGLILMAVWALQRFAGPLQAAVHAGAAWLVLPLQSLWQRQRHDFDAHPVPPLITAASRGDVPLVRALLDAPDPAVGTNATTTRDLAFAAAVDNGHPRTALLILKAGADPRVESGAYLPRPDASAASIAMARFSKAPEGAFRDLVLCLLKLHDMSRPDSSGTSPMDVLRNHFSAQEILDLRLSTE